MIGLLKFEVKSNVCNVLKKTKRFMEAALEKRKNFSVLF